VLTHALQQLRSCLIYYAGEKDTMITRIWHGWTTPANAPKYEALLREEIFVGIGRRHLPGYHGISLLKRTAGSEVEFVTVMWFADTNAVRSFAGSDYETAVVPPKARALLTRFDVRSAHYETVCPPPGLQGKTEPNQ
jgi:antibiotic biosynthesis monooxygenase (ABM) superfamily enzyme